MVVRKEVSPIDYHNLRNLQPSFRKKREEWGDGNRNSSGLPQRDTSSILPTFLEHRTQQKL